MMRTINTHEAKTKLSKVLAELEKTGEPVLICRKGKPIAELVPYRTPSRLQYHPVMSKISINYDPTEELTDEEWGHIEE